MLYADVVLPLSLQGLFTYAIPADLQGLVREGSRVIVQFGKKRFYTAIVFKLHSEKKNDLPIKEINSLLEDFPIITHYQIEFWDWIASYYMCTLGDVYRAALPSALKLESETRVFLNSTFEDTDSFSTSEYEVFYRLQENKAVTIADIQKSFGVASVMPVIRGLVDKKAIFLNEVLENTYSAKTVSYVKYSKDYSESQLHDLLDGLKRAKKQYLLFSTFIRLSEEDRIVSKKSLLEEADVSSAVLSELIKKEYLTLFEVEVNRIDYGDSDIESAYDLNGYQRNAFDQIKELFREKDTVLLHGVTSSGKTEIYIHLIKEAIQRDKQVLFLLPEIALTTQITDRLKSIFGNMLAVYHSKFNDNERAEVWSNLLKNDDVKVILGARSAIFLPFSKLELIIVDEEHESSYKQQDPAPRYNARNAALMLAHIYGAKVLLGTATPSIETYSNALSGRYGLVELSKRHKELALPQIEVVNTKELRRKKQMKSILSPPLIERMKVALDKQEQVILFQNRRGFSSMIECETCSWVPHCQYCDVSLTYHKGQRLLICHYCGATYNVPNICPDCKTPTLNSLGYGTERIEEEVLNLFPDIAVGRMDFDTTRGKRAYERIISDFERGETRVLIGTQMVTKGLDFGNVSTVGILNADNLLNYPDFRAYERAFQLMTQVSGRAGRKNSQGVVLLQTAHPSNALIGYVRNTDYVSFYRLQMEERKLFRYPPFFRLISIVLRGRDQSVLTRASLQFVDSLKESFGDRILGPAKPPISRVQSLYILNVMLKIENGASIQKVRESLYFHQNRLFENANYKGILLHYDVDPM